MTTSATTMAPAMATRRRTGRPVGVSLVRHDSADDPCVDLVCCPAAGEQAARFGSWTDHVGPDIGVLAAERAGRGRRLGEQADDRLADVIEEVVRDLDGSERPLVLVGHSAGSLVAHGIAARLAVEQPGRVLAMVASHGRSPTVVGRVAWSEAGDDRLTDELLATRPELAPVLARRDIAALFLEPLRADLRLYHDVGDDPPPLDCPLVVLGADGDPLVCRTDLWRWRELARGPFVAQMVAGGHFEPIEQPARFLGVLTAMLAAHVPGWPR